MIVRPPPRPTGAAAIAFAATVSALGPLREWGPVAERVSAVLDALRGEDGATEHEIGRLREWAARWSRMSVRLRAFYATAAPENERVSDALFWLLDHRIGARPPLGIRIGARVACEALGTLPADTELFPRLEA